MPSRGFLGCTYLYSTITVGYIYARKHTPWVNWLGTGPNSIPAAISVPVTELPKDYNKLPNVSFVIPDMDYEMRNLGIGGNTAAIYRSDKWLKDHLQGYAEWAKKHNSLLIVTFNENDYDAKNGNKIVTIFYVAKINPGEYHASINYYNVLHTIKLIFGLPLTDVFKAFPISSQDGLSNRAKL